MITVIFSAVSVGVGALRENPLRTVLSTLGVIIGVASLTAVLTLGDTLQSFAKLEVGRKTDAQSITIESRTWHVVDNEWEPIKNVARLSEQDFNQLVDALPDAKASWMTRNGSAQIAYRKTGRERNAGISAVSAGILAMDRPRIVAGRSFSPREADVNAAVVVLSHRLAEELADGQSAESMVGKQVRVGRIPREVIGVFERSPGERSYNARIPLSGASATFPPSSMVQPAAVTLRARDLDEVAPLRAGVEDWLAQRYIGWEAKFELVLAEEMLAEINQVFLVLKAFLGTLAGISMLVGGVGIMNIMLASVTERTREIGIRKAIGATRQDIQLQFLTEAVTISFLGSGVGTLIGLSISSIAVAVMRYAFKEDSLSVFLSPGTLVLSAGIAVSVGLIFGTYPARRASRLSPIEAIRHE